MSVYTLIPLVMADIGAVSKDRRNEQQKYAFRGIEDFYKAAHPAFVKHGVFCVPEVVEHTFSEFEKPGYEGKTTIWRHVTIKVRHRFYGPQGDFVDVVTVGEGLDNSDKATNKAMSGAMKYALIELFSVPTEDVEDSDRTTPERPAVKPRTFTKPAEAPSTIVAGTGQFVKITSNSGAMGNEPHDGSKGTSQAPEANSATLPLVAESERVSRSPAGPSADASQAGEGGAKHPPAAPKKRAYTQKSTATAAGGFLPEPPVNTPPQELTTAQRFHRRFREECRPEIKKHAGALLAEWLKHYHPETEGHASKIPEDQILIVWQEAAVYARGL